MLISGFLAILFEVNEVIEIYDFYFLSWSSLCGAGNSDRMNLLMTIVLWFIIWQIYLVKVIYINMYSKKSCNSWRYFLKKGFIKKNFNKKLLKSGSSPVGLWEDSSFSTWVCQTLLRFQQAPVDWYRNMQETYFLGEFSVFISTTNKSWFFLCEKLFAKNTFLLKSG